MLVRLSQLRPRAFALPSPQSRVALLAPVFFAVAILAAVLLAQTGYVTTSGYYLQSLERASAAKQREIQQLEAQLASLTSLTRVEAEAKARWNMAPPEKLVYVTAGAAPSAGWAAAPTRKGP